MHDPAEHPTVVLVMWDWGVEVPWWDRSPGRPWGLLDPDALDVSPDLVARFRAWCAVHDDAPDGPEAFAWPSPEAGAEWQRRGLHLAYALQHELGPDVEVLYVEDGDPRPVADRRGR